MPSPPTHSGKGFVSVFARSCWTDAPSVDIAALNCGCVTNALAGVAASADEFNSGDDDGENAADLRGEKSGDLTNGDCVVWLGVASGGPVVCGCCGVLDASAALPEVVAVSGGD